MNQIYEQRIAASVEGREIFVESNFDPAAPVRPANVTLLVAGMHGDEKATVALLATFREMHIATGRIRSPVALIVLANPDGFAANTRYNAHGVDLNRNCSTHWDAASAEPPGPEPWSEPETRALRDFILGYEPSKIVSLHWALAEIDADGPQSTGLGRRMWNAMTPEERAPYRLRTADRDADLAALRNLDGFCPGSLGQWCGYELRFNGRLRPSMITLELPYDPGAECRPDPLPEGHLSHVHARWNEDPHAYIEAVQPGVHRMLAAACAYPR